MNKKNLRKLVISTYGIMTFGALLLPAFGAGAVLADETDNKVATEIFNNKFKKVKENISLLKSGIDGKTPVLQVDYLVNAENNREVFCREFSKPSPNGQDYHSNSKASKEFTYLAKVFNDYYYGSSKDKNLTGDKETDFMIIQYAIHSYDDSHFKYFTHDGTETGIKYKDDMQVIPRIKALIDEANKSQETITPNFVNKVSLSADSTELSRIGDNYESKLMTINAQGNLKNQSLSVDLKNAPTNTKIEDEKGKVITGFKDGTKFKLVINKSQVTQDLKINLQANGKFENEYQETYEFVEDTNQFQKIAHLETVSYSETKDDSKELNVKYVSYKGSIKIHKQDENKKAVANAEFTKTDKNGKTEVKSTDKNGEVSFDIDEDNTYSVKETKVPDGYVGSFEKDNITLKDDNQVFEYTAVNKHKPQPIPQTGSLNYVKLAVQFLAFAGVLAVGGFLLFKNKSIKKNRGK